MTFELISEADYERLPVDPYQKFAAIEEICRRNMMEAISHETPEDFDTLVRTSYMTIVAEVADELGIGGVKYVDHFNSVQQDVQEFIRIVSGVVARIRLRKSSGRDAFSVRLAARTKGIIENEVSKLRQAVSDSELDDEKKRRLMAKLEEFRTELHKERFGYATAFATLTIIAAGIGGTTSFLSDAPDAVTTIVRLIGQEKENEEAEIFRLEAPPIRNLLTNQSKGKTSRHSQDMHDDIPF